MSPTEFKIRQARPDDIFALSSVYAETQRATYQGIIPHDALELAIGRRKPEWWRRNIGNGSSTQIVQFNDRAEGYVTFGPSRYGDNAYGGEIYEIYIRPAFQGCGMGQKLFNCAQAALVRSNHMGLMLWTISANEKAGGFFRHLGGAPFASSQINYRTKSLTRTAIGWLNQNQTPKPA